MKFAAAFVALALAAGSAALSTPRDTTGHCAGARTVSTSTVAAPDGRLVTLTTVACGGSAARKRAFTPGNPSAAPSTPGSTPLFPVGAAPVSPSASSPAVPSASPASPASPSAPAPSSTSSAVPPPVANVCAENCTPVCTNSGSLPPTSEDCETIMDAITILNGSVTPTFVVQPGHQQTLSFGTCAFFFQNFGPNPLESCWLSFGQDASAAGAACFPPVQPVNSEGLCVAKTGLWRAGAAHA